MSLPIAACHRTNRKEIRATEAIVREILLGIIVCHDAAITRISQVDAGS